MDFTFPSGSQFHAFTVDGLGINVEVGGAVADFRSPSRSQEPTGSTASHTKVWGWWPYNCPVVDSPPTALSNVIQWRWSLFTRWDNPNDHRAGYSATEQEYEKTK